MNAKRYKDLSAQEREVFTKAFYEYIDALLPQGTSLDDRDSPRPWGCPWDLDYYAYSLISSEDIKESAKAYAKLCAPEITAIIKIA